MKQGIDKTMVSRAVISKLENEMKPAKIKAKHVLGFESPNKISFESKEPEYIPDIAAIYDESMSFYEIELNKNIQVEKWRLLSLYAKKNKGNLYLVVPDYLKETIKEEIEENNINAGVLVFQT